MNKKFLSMLLITSFTVPAFAQNKVYQIKADSVRIFSNCDTAEFILENRTRALLNGVLTNKENGITEFRKVMIKLNDSLYSIGGDTLDITSLSRNIYNSNGVITDNRVIDINNKNLQFRNGNTCLIANNDRPVMLSRTPVDSSLAGRLNNIEGRTPSGLVVRGTGCDAAIRLVSDSSGSCNEDQLIDFITLKPRSDSWLTHLPGDSYGDKNLLGRIELQTSNQLADYASLSFAVKSDTAFFHDGAYTLYTAGYTGGYMPMPVMSINPSFKHPRGYQTNMPFVQVNGGLFVGYGRNSYFNSKNARDIIYGVDDVSGYLQPFYDTRFSVYADSLPLKIYKLPAVKGSAFLTYSPTRTVEGNNVAFEYKDSVYEDIRNYISVRGIGVPSDSSLKEHIVNSSFDINKLLLLNIKDFSYKSGTNKGICTGLIAQELKTLMPELVIGQEGHYSIDYSRMVPYLLKALQEQQKQLVILQQQPPVTRTASPDMLSVFSALQQLQQQVVQQQESLQYLQEQLKSK